VLRLSHEKSAEQKFWPFKPRLTLAATVLSLVGLLLVIAILRAIANWPSAQSETVVLIGALLLSLLPIGLALLDVIIERGGTVEYGKVKIDFSRSREKASAGLTVAPNIGVQGQPVSDSATAQILDTLRQATANEIVVVDLEDGQAWWETRLLVLVAGAVRLGKPDKIVFLGKDANRDRQFRGWSYADDLLPRLLAAHPQYARSLHSAWAAGRQWGLVEPLDAPSPADVTVPPPPPPPWISGRLATAHSWMACDPATGLPNRLFAEQILQSDLGQKIEMQPPGPRSITLPRLEELFGPILYKDSIDLGWPPERQLEVFLNSQAAFIAATLQGTYAALVSRAALANEVLRSLALANGGPRLAQAPSARSATQGG
jgi:hypothetical protein